MIGTPRVAFCITCKNRTQHLEQTLALNLLHNISYPNLRIIVLDYHGSDHFHTFITTHFQSYLDSGVLSIYSHKTPGMPFHMAHAKNMVHRLGIKEEADILVNVDADNITGPDFAHYIAMCFASGSHQFLFANMVKGEMPRGISGRIAVTAKAFLLSGGYDEKFATWGPDDKQFNKRLRTMGYVAKEIPSTHLLGVRHSDKMRFKEYRHAATTQPEEEFTEVEGCSETIANFGNFGCGVVYKNFDFSHPIALNPLPTRIFGIGLHKTATTSLHHAFGLLGFDSAHWRSAHWAKAIWNEMQAGRSRTVEDSYCLSDLPIPLLYDKLDKAYPNSKFILTIRNEENWIRSVRSHWSDKNEFRSSWATDPFTFKIHRELYGTTEFNEEIFRQRYRRHNAEVIQYFDDRHDDLLIMNMDDGGSWFELCRFLNCAIPNVKYPKKYVTHNFRSGLDTITYTAPVGIEYPAGGAFPAPQESGLSIPSETPSSQTPQEDLKCPTTK